MGECWQLHALKQCALYRLFLATGDPSSFTRGLSTLDVVFKTGDYGCHSMPFPRNVIAQVSIDPASRGWEPTTFKKELAAGHDRDPRRPAGYTGNL